MDLKHAQTLLSMLSVEARAKMPIELHIPTRPRGTVKKWFEGHDGKTVWTLQAHLVGEVVANVWTPGPRTVDASHSTFVLLGGSKREYAGFRVLAADEAVLVAETDWGMGTQFAIYILDTRNTPVLG